MFKNKEEKQAIDAWEQEKYIRRVDKPSPSDNHKIDKIKDDKPEKKSKYL